jgi:hypothetical protein
MYAPLVLPATLVQPRVQSSLLVHACAPRGGRRADAGGQQLYALAQRVTLYVDVDKGLVMARHGSQQPWRPVSLGALVAMAKTPPPPAGGTQ